MHCSQIGSRQCIYPLDGFQIEFNTKLDQDGFSFFPFLFVSLFLSCFLSTFQVRVFSRFISANAFLLVLPIQISSLRFYVLGNAKLRD